MSGHDLPLYRSDRFEVRIGRQRVACSSVEGLASASGLDDQPAVVSLVRAVSGDSTFFDWWKASRRSRGRQVEIMLLGSTGDLAVVWTLHGAKPVQWMGPGLDGLDPSIAFERLALTYHELTWDSA